MNDLVNRLKSFEPTIVERWPGNDGETWRPNIGMAVELIQAAADSLETQERLIEYMRGALKPFADNASDWDQDWVDRARSVLSKSNPNTPERNDE